MPSSSPPSEWDRQRIEQQLINLYRYQGNLEEMLQKAEDEGTLSYEMQKARAEHFRNAGELEKAVDSYKKVLQMTTGSYEQNRISGELLNLYVQLDKIDLALEFYETEASKQSRSRRVSTSYSSSGITVKFGNDDARKTLISAYKNQEKLDVLRTLFEGKLEQDADNPSVLEMLAEIYSDANDHQKAAETYRALCKAEPGNIRSFYNAAVAFHKNNQPDMVKEILKEAETALASSSYRRDESFLGALATICLKSEMYDPAIKLADNAITEAQDSANDWYLEYLGDILGKSYLGAKRYEEAFAAYQKVANVADDSSTRNRAKTEMDKIAKTGKLYEKWIPEQLQKVAENPDDSKITLKLAESYEATNKIKEAVEQYEKLAELESENSQWYKKLGDLYQNMPPERRETGKVIEGTALALSGNGSFVEIGDSDTLNSITEQVTVSLWIKPTNFPNSYAAIICRGDERGPNIRSVRNRSYVLYLKDDGSIQMAASPNGRHEASFYSESGVIKLNTWYHIACVIDAKNNSMKLFIDGIEVGNRDFKEEKSLYKSRLPLRIGWTHEETRPTQSPFVGLMDEVRIWNIARTEAEIRSDMNKQLNGDEPGLVGYWKFDEEKDGQIFDSTSNKNDGKLIGNAKLEPYTRPIFESVEGTALTLGGNGSYVEIGDSESLDNITDQVTVSAWIKPTSFPNNYVRIIFRSDEQKQNYRQRSYILVIRSDGKLKISSSPKDGGYASLYSPPGLIKLNTWTHIAGVIDAKKDYMKVFVNGYEVGHRHYNGEDGFVKCRLPLRIGVTHIKDEVQDTSFIGQIDEVRVWNVPRTEAEIRTDMNKQLNGDEPGLVGYWKFDAETEGVVHDATSNKNDGKLIGNAKLEPYTRPVFESLKTEHLTKATIAYQKAIELEPKSYQSYDLLAKLFIKQNQTSDAESVYRQALDAALTQSEHDSAIQAIAGLYADEGQENERIAILEEFTSKIEKSAVLQELLGDLYKKTEDSEKAKLAYAKWLEIRQKEMNRRQSASGYRNFADKLMDKELYPETALKFAKRALKSYTGTSYYYPTTLGRAYITNGLYDNAFKHYKHALSIITSEYSLDQFWRRVAEAGKMAKDTERYIQMLDALTNAIPSGDSSSRANVYRILAQFYSENDMPENAENYLLKSGFIPETRWITLGPFKNRDSSGVLYAYIPEETTQIDTTAKYYGREKLIGWEKPSDNKLDGLFDFGNKDGINNDSAAYAWAVIISPDERDITFRFDSDDQGTVWLNGEKVFEHHRTSGVVIDRYTIPGTLKQGENTLLVKVCNAWQNWDFYMRLTDADGNAFGDLQFKNADALLNAPPPEPTFHLNVNLGLAEYYSKNDMLDKAMEQMEQTGILHENVWQILGTFDNSAGIGYNTEYIPENTEQIDLTAKYEGVDEQISWKKFTDDAFDGFIDFGKDINWRVSYAYATVTSPDEREVQFRFGSDDQGKVWLNGKEVFANPNGGWAIIDDNIIPVTLKAGKNTILVKVCNGELSWGFYLRITDADGKPFEDLKINDEQDK